MRLYVKKFLARTLDAWFVFWCIAGGAYLLFVLYIIFYSLTL